MRSKLPTLARYLLGLVFFVFGLNFFFNFIKQPVMAGDAAAFIGALHGSGYVMTMVKVIEVGAGVMLLANRFVPLALGLLAPIVVNIVAFHARFAHEGLPPALVFLALELFLAWCYRRNFALMLVANAKPNL